MYNYTFLKDGSHFFSFLFPQLTHFSLVEVFLNIIEASGIHLQGSLKTGKIEIIESHNVKVILFWIKLDLLGSDEAEHSSPTPSPPQSLPVAC